LRGIREATNARTWSSNRGTICFAGAEATGAGPGSAAGGWELPECFPRLRRLLEARLNKGGKREYVQVLRLLETFSLPEVEAAIGDALHLARSASDAVKHLLLCRIERRPPRLDLENYPHLPWPTYKPRKPPITWRCSRLRPSCPPRLPLPR